MEDSTAHEGSLFVICIQERSGKKMLRDEWKIKDLLQQQRRPTP